MVMGPSVSPRRGERCLGSSIDFRYGAGIPSSTVLAGCGVDASFPPSRRNIFATIASRRSKCCPWKVITQPIPCLRSHPKHNPSLLLRFLGTAEKTCSSGSNETGLLTLSSVSRNCRGFADMLMITTTVRMVDRVHGNTTGLGPGVALDGELMLCARCFCDSC